MKSVQKTKKDTVVYGVFVAIAGVILISSLVVGIGSANAQTTLGTTTTFPANSTATTTAYPFPSVMSPNTGSASTTTVYPTQTPGTTDTGSTTMGTTSNSTTTPTIASTPSVSTQSTPVPEILSVGTSGNALLRGTVTSVGGNSIVLNSWGGAWTINVSGATEMIPAGPATSAGTPSGISVGDFVGVDGTISAGSSWAIDATIVHDWTTSHSAGSSVSSSGTSNSANSATTAMSVASSSSSSSVPSGDTLYTGTASDVSNIGSGTFTLTGSNGATYTVNIPSGATIWNATRQPIALSNIAQNDSIRLDGSLASDGSITADVVRDTSQ